MNSKPNAIVAQSGGQTAVINLSACSMIQQAVKSDKKGRVIGATIGKNGPSVFMRFERKPLEEKLAKYM